MSCSCKGFGAAPGNPDMRRAHRVSFGLDVSTSSGVLTGDPCDPTTDPRVSLPMLQQMLSDLGFYRGPLGGALTPEVALQFSAASAAYAQSKGFDATTPQPTVCASLVGDWQSKKATQRNLLIGGAAALVLGAYLVFRSKR